MMPLTRLGAPTLTNEMAEARFDAMQAGTSIAQLEAHCQWVISEHGHRRLMAESPDYRPDRPNLTILGIRVRRSWGDNDDVPAFQLVRSL